MTHTSPQLKAMHRQWSKRAWREQKAFVRSVGQGPQGTILNSTLGSHYLRRGWLVYTPQYYPQWFAHWPKAIEYACKAMRLHQLNKENELYDCTGDI